MSAATPLNAPTLANRATGIAPDMMHLVGQTPMVQLSSRINTTSARILLKLESENPMASVKDRLGLAILVGAERDGKIHRGRTTLIEATSGNTGIGLAQMAAILGYRLIITMPETMSVERRTLLSIFGAEVHLTPAQFGMKGALAYAKKLHAEIPDSYLTGQFETEYNAQIHYETTGPEIWAQTQGTVDYFVSGVGTGGTITGAGRFLREHNPQIQIFAIEPDESPVINGGAPGPHKIQGIGAGFIPPVLDRGLLSGALRVTSDEAITMCRRLPREAGLFAGLSSGAAVHAAMQLAQRPEAAGKTIVVIIPSFGERYISTVAFQATRDEATRWPVLPVEQVQAIIAQQAAAAAPAPPAQAPQ